MILLRTLRKDYQRYKHDEESISDIERDLGDEYGWKQIHGDVFRCANYPSVLASIVSSGWHLFLTIIFELEKYLHFWIQKLKVCVEKNFMVIIGLAITEHIWVDHGELITYGLYVYVMLSPVNGYIGGAMFARMANQATQLTDIGTSKKIRNEKTKGKHIKKLTHFQVFEIIKVGFFSIMYKVKNLVLVDSNDNGLGDVSTVIMVYWYDCQCRSYVLSHVANY